MSGDPAETRWSLVSRAQGDTPAARAALSELCEIYYAPVLAYTRRWSSPAEAPDLAHAFFETFLERAAIDGASQERGRFRSYLLGAVKHFLCETRAKQKRQKRGDRHEHVALETEVLGDSKALPPDAEFDRAWACALLDRALSSLEQEMDSAGKRSLFETLRPWLAGTASRGDQLETATLQGMSETAVRVHVHRLRRRFREIIEAEVSQTLEPGADAAAELRHLLAVW